MVTYAIRTATSNSTVGSVGLVGGAGSSSTSRISGSLDAFIGDGATVVVAGAVIVRSTGTATATADARGGTAAAIGIAAFFASASIAPVSGTDMGTRAWVGANSNVVAGGALVVSANAIDRATATLLAVAVTLGGGAGGSATATVDSDVEAFIGVRSGSSGTVVEATDVVVMAASIQNATATATGGGGGVLTVAALRATTNIASTVQAVVATTVTASGAVTVQAGQTANADSTVIVGAVALGVGTGAEARSTVGGLVAARVGPGATVSAGGELTVSADTAARSHAKAEGGSGGGVGINVMLGDATTSVVTSASIGDGSRVLRAAGITMWARRGGITGLAETTLGEILVVGVGFVDGSGGRGDATDSGGVTAAVGDNAELTATGGVVDVSASSVTLTKGVARGFSVSLVTSVVVPVTHATHSATTAAAVGANTAVTAASLAVTASATTNVRVEALTVGVSLAGGAGSDAQAQSSGLTEARVGPAFGTTVAATRGVNVTGAVTIRAAVAQTAEAEARSGAGGAIGIGGLTVRAFVDGSTRAFVGNGARVQAGSLTIEVTGVTGTSAARTATSNSTVGSVGLVGGAGSSSTSRISGSLDAFIGTTATVVVTGAVIVRSTGTATATADARGGSGGLLNVERVLCDGHDQTGPRQRQRHGNTGVDRWRCQRVGWFAAGSGAYDRHRHGHLAGRVGGASRRRGRRKGHGDDRQRR